MPWQLTFGRSSAEARNPKVATVTVRPGGLDNRSLAMASPGRCKATKYEQREKPEDVEDVVTIAYLGKVAG